MKLKINPNNIDWDALHIEITIGVLCSRLPFAYSKEEHCKESIEWADELIKQLKQRHEGH